MRCSPLFIAACAALTLSACAKRPAPDTVAGPIASPGGAQAPAAPAPITPSPQTASLQDALAAQAGDRVYFGFDSYEISGEAMSTLQAQAAWLARNPQVRVLIAGNCDERGAREYNLALGARRASAVRDSLVRLDVAPARMQTVSYGKERPIDAGSGEDAWSRNRNGHTVVLDLGPR